MQSYETPTSPAGSGSAIQDEHLGTNQEETQGTSLIQSDTELNPNPEGRVDDSSYEVQARCQQPCSACGNWAQCALFETHSCFDGLHMCETCGRGYFVDYLRNRSNHESAGRCISGAWEGINDQQKLDILLVFGIPWKLAFSATHGWPRTKHSNLAIPTAWAEAGAEIATASASTASKLEQCCDELCCAGYQVCCVRERRLHGHMA